MLTRVQIFCLGIAVCLISTGCSSVVPVESRGEPTVKIVSDGVYEIRLAEYGPAGSARVQQAAQGHAKGLCGSGNYELFTKSIDSKGRTQYVSGMFIESTQRVSSIEIRCTSPEGGAIQVVPRDTEIADGQSLLTIANTSGFLYNVATGAIAIRIDGSNVTTLPKNRRLTLRLKPGTYQMVLAHKDAHWFESVHSLEVVPGQSAIKIWATAFGNKYAVADKVPSGVKPYLGTPSENSQQ